MKLTVWGAAKQVTGSQHLLQVNGYTILIDCGICYDNADSFSPVNKNFNFSPAQVDCLILTHAHIDHSGNIPNLIKQGFNGPIFTTHPTSVLSHYLLHDNLNIQRQELASMHRRKNRGKKRRGATHVYDGELLYGKKHIKKMDEQLKLLNYNHEIEILPEVFLTFYDAGHILGSASARISCQGKTIGFTGDLGNYGAPQMNDPIPMPQLNYLVMESTYGGRLHQKSGKAQEELYHYIQQTCVEKKGKLVIPAFSVGRTQSILFTINQLYQSGKIQNIKIYTDSPLAIKSTEAYENNSHFLNQEARDFDKKHGSLFNFPLLYVVDDNHQSELLSVLNEPCVIVSAAGMVEGGRIQTHVRNNVGNPNNTILIAGYCAEGTLGARLLSGQDFIEIKRKPMPVKASIARTDAFSAHPDHNGLLRYIKESANANLQKIMLVHADENRMDALIADIKNYEVLKPTRGEEIEL